MSSCFYKNTSHLIVIFSFRCQTLLSDHNQVSFQLWKDKEEVLRKNNLLQKNTSMYVVSTLHLFLQIVCPRNIEEMELKVKVDECKSWTDFNKTSSNWFCMSNLRILAGMWLRTSLGKFESIVRSWSSLQSPWEMWNPMQGLQISFYHFYVQNCAFNAKI